MQIDSIPDVLRSNPTQNIIFVGNNVPARAIAASLSEKNVLFAFSLSAGHWEADHAAFVLQNRRQFIKLKGNTVLRFFKFICATELERDALHYFRQAN